MCSPPPIHYRLPIPFWQCTSSSSTCIFLKSSKLVRSWMELYPVRVCVAVWAVLFTAIILNFKKSKTKLNWHFWGRYFFFLVSPSRLACHWQNKYDFFVLFLFFLEKSGVHLSSVYSRKEMCSGEVPPFTEKILFVPLNWFGDVIFASALLDFLGFLLFWRFIEHNFVVLISFPICRVITLC